MRENISLEFKRQHNEKVNHTMLAFLNTNGGTLYIGISDDGSVYGIDGNIDEMTRKIISSFRDSISPDPSGYFTVEPEQREGRYVIKVEVERGISIPYCYKSHGLVPQGVYVRIGSNTVMATREHIRQMIKDNSAGQFIAELSIEQDLTFNAANKIFASRDIKFGVSQKQSLGLIRPDGRYTNLALILSDQCPYTTKAAIFEGTDKERFKDRKEFTGSLFTQIDEVLAYLHVFNRIHGTFEGAYRVDHPDYPEVALREAYVNAQIHRDFYIEGSILISMFDDRLEFMSLGGLMPGITRDLMLTGISVARNEKLAQIFYRLKIIEAFGTGIPRIFSTYKNCDAKPEIPIVDGGFLIRIPNTNYTSEQVATEAAEGGAMAAKEKSMLVAFAGRSFTKEEAAKELGISVSGAYKFLQRMCERGLLTSQKDGKHLVYRAVHHEKV